MYTFSVLPLFCSGCLPKDSLEDTCKSQSQQSSPQTSCNTDCSNKTFKICSL